MSPCKLTLIWLAKDFFNVLQSPLQKENIWSVLQLPKHQIRLHTSLRKRDKLSPRDWVPVEKRDSLPFSKTPQYSTLLGSTWCGTKSHRWKRQVFRCVLQDKWFREPVNVLASGSVTPSGRVIRRPCGSRGLLLEVKFLRMVLKHTRWPNAFFSSCSIGMVRPQQLCFNALLLCFRDRHEGGQLHVDFCLWNRTECVTHWSGSTLHS